MEPLGRFSRYTLIALLARGGMGAVYRARDERLEREVALKILFASADAESQQRAVREARAVASLEHRNVVAIYDVDQAIQDGDTAPSMFIAMELVRGEALRALIGRSSVDLVKRVEWLRDVADALAYAHEHGIIHRDVKPENVMIRHDGVVKVLDFGIARRHSGHSPSTAPAALTEKGVVLGTPRYMAPEQMLDEELDGRADEFAWGVVAYELLTGHPPWAGSSDSLRTVAEMLVHPHVPIRDRLPNVPAEVAGIVERAMSRARRDRFPTMREVTRALDAWLRAGAAGMVDTQHAAAVTAPAATPARAPRRRPLAIALLLGAAAIAVAALATSRSRHHALAVSRPCSARDCTARAAAASVCRPNGTCATLASVDCHVAAAPGDVDDERTTWLGAMFPLTGPDADAFGQREYRAVDLARTEVAGVMSGTNTGALGADAGMARPIALVACDDAVDPARALRHLVDDVGVPAVIGFHTSQEAIDLATSILQPRGVLGLSALNASPMLTRLPHPPGQPRLVWRAAISSAQTAVAAAALIPDVVEPLVRTESLGPKAPLRVALVRQDDAAGRGFADAVFRRLRFNDRAAVDNGANFQEYLYPFGSDVTDEARYDTVAASVVAFAPQVVLYFGGDDAFVRVLAPLERGWPAAVPRPVYVKPAVFGPEIRDFVGRDAQKRKRFLGLTSTSSSVANARFVARYNDAYGDHVTRTFSPNSSYDSFYLLAYATYAQGGGPVTGAGLAQAISRLVPPGEPVDVGPEDVFTAIAALTAGKNIDLNGASGGLDFDPATGETPVDLAVLCFDVDARGAAHDSIESGLVFNAVEHAFRGSLTCP